MASTAAQVHFHNRVCFWVRLGGYDLTTGRLLISWLSRLVVAFEVVETLGFFGSAASWKVTSRFI